MRLVIDEYGLSIGKKENRFEIRKKGKVVEEISADKVDQIIVINASAITTDAMRLAVKHYIDIVVLGDFGIPEARIFPCSLGGTNLTKHNQALAYQNREGYSIGQKLIWAKVKNQQYFVRSLNKTRDIAKLKDAEQKISNSADEILKVKQEGENSRNVILGLEGLAGKAYFSALSCVIPMTKREHDASDPINSSLNYGYGILYGEAERACLLAGLDPYLGFFHVDRYGKQSLVLDLVEEFRPIVVDRAVVTLWVRNEMDDSDFQYIGKQCFLSKSGRKKIVQQVLDRLHAKVSIGESEQEIHAWIVQQARDIASNLNKQKEFIPFVYKW